MIFLFLLQYVNKNMFPYGTFYFKIPHRKPKVTKCIILKCYILLVFFYFKQFFDWNAMCDPLNFFFK